MIVVMMDQDSDDNGDYNNDLCTSEIKQKVITTNEQDMKYSIYFQLIKS